MNRWIRVLLWSVMASVMVLLAVGMLVWATNLGVPKAVIITPTPQNTPPPSISVTPADASKPSPTVTPTDVIVPSATPTTKATDNPENTPTLTLTPSMTPIPSPTPTAPPVIIPVVTLPVIDSTPVVNVDLPQPTPMPLIDQPEGTVNILLLGSDRRPGEEIGRTDVIVIASVYPELPSVNLVSVPRDYFAWIPSWGLDKINTAYVRAKRTQYPGGGPALVKDTIAYNFGIPIHHYAMVDFSSYRSIVDAVGGIDLVIECPFHDTYPDEESESGQTDIDLEPGVHHLDGKFALWYVRSRWNTSDFDRHRRQQQVLRAILHQALNQNMLVRLPELWSVYKESVITDMTLTDILSFVPTAVRLDERDIKSRFIRGKELLTSWTAPNGGYVLVPNYEALYTFMLEAAQPQVTSRAAQRAYQIYVMNGTGNTGWGQVAAYRLALEGLEVAAVQDVGWEPRTTLIDYTTSRKGSPLSRLFQLYRLNQADVKYMSADDLDVDFSLRLGGNYNPCIGTGSASWRATPTPAAP